jgi:hypothetical protein
MKFYSRSGEQALIELIDAFADAMKARVRVQAENGRQGWDSVVQCPTDRLRQCMLKNAGQDDASGLVDQAVYAAFLWNRK